MRAHGASKVPNRTTKVRNRTSKLHNVTYELDDIVYELRNVTYELHNIIYELHNVRNEPHNIIYELHNVKNELHNIIYELHNVTHELHNWGNQFWPWSPLMHMPDRVDSVIMHSSYSSLTWIFCPCENWIWFEIFWCRIRFAVCTKKQQSNTKLSHIEDKSGTFESGKVHFGGTLGPRKCEKSSVSTFREEFDWISFPPYGF